MSVPNRLTRCLSVLLVCACAISAATARIYHIGNSLTDQVRYSNFKALAESRGHTHIWGRQMIPGSPLGGLWASPSSGFTESPFGYPTSAFPGYTWDFIVMQPFDWSVAAESQAANDFWNLALNHSPDAVACIHMAWPRNDAQYGDYQTQWLDTTHGWTWTRRYFERIIDTVTQAHSTKSPVRALPMGEVMFELDKKIRAGRIPGYNTIWDIYNDGVHLNDVGSYITAVTHYAVIYRDDPVGLPTTGFTIDGWLADTIQHIVRNVVLAYPRCRVSSFGPYPVTGLSVTPSALELNTGASSALDARVLPTNATNKNVTWSTSNVVVATVSAGVVQAQTGGTCYVIATSADGGFKDSCAITVVSTGTAVSSVAIVPDTIIVVTPSSRQLSATISPAGATNTGLDWYSLDPTIASVNATGLVTAVKKGSTGVVVMTRNGGKRDTCGVKVIVPNQAPVAVLGANPLVGYAPCNVQFDGRGSRDPDSASGDFVLGYDWDFGDGSTWAFTVTPRHTYGVAGFYTVRLRVLDDNETRSAWVSQVIEVRERDASVICYDGFEYPDGPLHLMGGGQGWGAAWNVQNGDVSVPGFNVQSASAMTVGDLRTTGGYMVGGDSYQGAGRSFDVRDTGAFKDILTFARIGLPGTTLWMSALMRKQTADNSSVGLALNNAGIVTGYDNQRIGIGYFGPSSDNGGLRYWGIQVDTVTHRSPAQCIVNQTALLVVRLDFAADATTATLYVNPPSLGGAAPASSDLSRATPAAFPFRTLGLMTGSGFNQSAFDEIRFGYTYASVTPTNTTSTGPSRGATGSIGAARRVVVAGVPVAISAADSDRLTICNMSGRIVWRGTAAQARQMTPGAMRGTFVVSANGTAARIVLADR